ncbi:MAG: succinate dehydrogenase, cytochrome b556 subunit [Burkholderiaceae bacterium]
MTTVPDPARKRPEFRNIRVTQIVRYRLPAPGIASILHRVSGALLFLLLPLLVWLFELSLSSETSFARLNGVVSHGFVKLVLLAVLWAFLHHLVAGIRYLLLDLHVGFDKTAAARSARVVLAVSLALTLLAGMRLFGVI